MLHALQHRGQEAVGITSNDGSFHSIRAAGLVSDTFNENNEHIAAELRGQAAIGHVRYSTAGSKGSSSEEQSAEAQPLQSDVFALAHNGNITNARTLRAEMGRQSATGTTVDTEAIAKLIDDVPEDKLVAALIAELPRLEGAYSLVILTKHKLIGICDPLGIRPLVLGQVNGAYAFASETCAFPVVRGDVMRDVNPGEIVVVEDGEIASFPFAQSMSPRPCIFEYVYFSRPDSEWGGRNMYQARQELGRVLAREDGMLRPDMHTGNPIVVPVLDSGYPAALGYAREAGLSVEFALVRNHYAIGRSFIEPTQPRRDLKVRLKHSVNTAVVSGRSVVLIDDSVVRGTTARLLVDLLREGGAENVHLRIASPPITHPCYYGIDTYARELIAHDAASQEQAEVRLLSESRADTVAYLSRSGMHTAVHGIPHAEHTACDACFSGTYPTALTDDVR